ncbi:MAG: ABC transporter substrate-binding protein [Clostridia bacterium]|nr:ABC transporter substrate-binding protein [Clostridia bacterium]
MKRILALVLAVLMIAGCCAALSSCSKTTKTIKIGLSGPLTGGAAVYGQAVKNAAQMAVDEINAAGGLNGIPLELKALDDVHDSSKIATNYAELMDWGMQVSLGCVTSAPCLEFLKYAKDDSVFFLTPSASNDGVPNGENSYQMCFADGNQGKVAADYVNSLYTAGNLGKLGIFYKSDDNYSKGIYDQFVANLNSAIDEKVMSFTDANATDFTTQIGALAECDFIFMPIYYEPAAQFMIQGKDTIRDTAVYYGCDGFDGLEGQLGDDMDEIDQAISMLSHFNSKATEGKAKEFIDKYTAKHGTDTLNQFGAAAYDCIYALHKAMTELIAEGKEIDHKTDAADLCEMLKGKFNGGFTYSGATGSNMKWEGGFVNKGAIAYEIKARAAA